MSREPKSSGFVDVDMKQILIERQQAADLLAECKTLAPAIVLATLKVDADLRHAKYPQYRGHWEGWKLCRINRKVETKMGVAFEAGDYAMLKPGIDHSSVLPGGTLTVYSTRTMIDTSVRPSCVEEV